MTRVTQVWNFLALSQHLVTQRPYQTGCEDSKRRGCSNNTAWVLKKEEMNERNEEERKEERKKKERKERRKRKEEGKKERKRKKDVKM